jgi:hypothetical protein
VRPAHAGTAISPRFHKRSRHGQGTTPDDHASKTASDQVFVGADDGNRTRVLSLGSGQSVFASCLVEARLAWSADVLGSLGVARCCACHVAVSRPSRHGTGRPASIRTRGIPTDYGTLKDRVIEDRITERVSESKRARTRQGRHVGDAIADTSASVMGRSAVIRMPAIGRIAGCRGGANMEHCTGAAMRRSGSFPMWVIGRDYGVLLCRRRGRRRGGSVLWVWDTDRRAKGSSWVITRRAR